MVEIATKFGVLYYNPYVIHIKIMLFKIEEDMHPIEEKILLDEESPLQKKKINKKELKIEATNDLEFYIISCAKALQSVSSAIVKSKISLDLINLDYVNFTTKNNENKAVYIETIIENSIIRIQAIYDRVLIFTNKILNLGISNESINHNLLVTNEHTKKFNLEEKLKSINKACNEYRFARNTIIHHDRFSESPLNELSLIINADHLYTIIEGAPFIEPEELKKAIFEYLEDKKKKLEDYLNKIEEKVFIFYDAILPIYDDQKKRLRE